MKVWIVLHPDYDDEIYIDGVYNNEAAASAHLERQGYGWLFEENVLSEAKLEVEDIR